MELVRVKTNKGKLPSGDYLVLPCIVNYAYITTLPQAEQAVEEIYEKAQNHQGMLALDVETSGFDPYLAELVTLQVGLPDNRQYIFDVRKLGTEALKEVLSPIFTAPCWKLGHNIKFDAKFIATKFGIKMSRFFDTFIAEKVLRGGGFTEGVGYALDAVLAHRLNKDLYVDSSSITKDEDAKKSSTVRAKKLMQQSFMELASSNAELTEAQLAYAAYDVGTATIFELARWQIKELNEPKMSTLYDPELDQHYMDPALVEQYQQMFPRKMSLWTTACLEFLFLEVVIDLELTGIGFNKALHKKVVKYIREDYETYKSKFLRLIAKTAKQLTLLQTAAINPDSNQQVLETLKELKLNVEDTGAETLDELLRTLPEDSFEHEVVECLSSYRKLSKLVSSFGDSLVEQLHKKTQRLHPNIDQVLATGRISMADPNLQQIPRSIPWVKTGDPVEDAKIAERPDLRECFQARDGYKLLIYDYSAQELRIAASISMDPLMIEAFRSEKDLHSFSACLMYHEDYDDFVQRVKDGDKDAKAKRTLAKVLSFGALYGSGAPNLSRKLRLPYEEAVQTLELYWNAYPELAKAMRRYGTLANKYGYSTTVLGRRRYYTKQVERIRWARAEQSLKGLHNQLKDLKMEWFLARVPLAEENKDKIKWKIVNKYQGEINRQSGNHAIQGTAADMVKKAAIYIHYGIKEFKYDASIVGLVHDEIIVECKDEDVVECNKLVAAKMNEAMLELCPNVAPACEGHVSQYWLKG